MNFFKRLKFFIYCVYRINLNLLIEFNFYTLSNIYFYKNYNRFFIKQLKKK